MATNNNIKVVILMYWERKVLKSRAKNVLRYSYWTVFLVMLLFSIATAMFGFSNPFEISVDVDTGLQILSPVDKIYNSLITISPQLYNIMQSVYPIIVSVVVVSLVISIGVTIFLLNPISVGINRYLYYNSKSKAKAGTVFSVFSKHYIKTVAVTLTVDLIIIIGYLLFVIPGIILSYALRMVPYIIAENPNIPLGRALELSYNMTNGQKLDMFILDLSFLGWIMLGALCLGVGVYFVLPYVQATEAELYGALRLRAARENLCTPSEIAAEYFV